jgi:hypothetical protein
VREQNCCVRDGGVRCAGARQRCEPGAAFSIWQMPRYIAGDGTIVEGTKKSWLWKCALAVAALCVVVQVQSQFSLTTIEKLSEGHVPAATRSDHWAYIFDHRATFMRAYTAHAAGILPDFLTRTPSLHDFLETGGARVADFGGTDGSRPEEVDITGSPEQMRENLAGTRCTSANFAITTYFCGAKAAAQKRNHYRLDDMEYFLDDLDAGMLPEADELRRAVFRFGITDFPLRGGDAGIDHVWTIIGNPNGTFMWFQAYIDEYSLGHWMELSQKAGVNPMSSAELRRRLHLLRSLEEPTERWDQKADDTYFELFNVRVIDRMDRHQATYYKRWDKALWKGGLVTFDLACTWPV